MNRSSMVSAAGASCWLLALLAIAPGCSSKPYSISSVSVVEAHIAPARSADMEFPMGSYSVTGFSDGRPEGDNEYFPTGTAAMERFQAFTRWWPSNKPFAAIGGAPMAVGQIDDNAVAIVDRPEGTFVFLILSLSNEWVLNTTGSFSGVLTFKDFELIAGSEKLQPLLVEMPDAQNRNNAGVEYPSSMELQFGRLTDSISYSSSTMGSTTVRCLFPRPADLSGVQLRVLGSEPIPVSIKGAAPASSASAAPATESPASAPPPPPPPPPPAPTS